MAETNQTVVIGVDEVASCFAKLEDPRSEVNRKHPLVSVVTIAVMAVLAGADGPTAIARWARCKAEFLLRVLSLPHGIPSKDVFARVLAALDPMAFQAGFTHWLSALRAKAAGVAPDEPPVFSIDGKTLRRTYDRKNGLGALHSVTVWATDYGLSLGQVACAEKSNEITAIPELLRLVDTRGAIITIDAMGTQTAIAEQIIDGGADYVLALKGNQESLHEAVVDYLHEQAADDFASCGGRRHVTHETGHGRDETRIYVQAPAPASLPGRERWKNLTTIGMAILICLRDGKETMEVRCFISSLALGVKQFARAVQSHWGIENSLHWSLDVTYREDHLRIRRVRLRENMAWLNRFTLSLLKQHPGKLSLAMKRRSSAWSEEFLFQVVTGQGG